MTRFSAAFLLVFAQLAWGGLVALAVPPFAVLDRGFYRSSAGIFLGAAITYVAGRGALVWRAGAASGGDVAELAVWVAFVGAFVTYLVSLWRESAPLRARSFALALAIGLVALALSALRWRIAPGPVTTLVYPLAVVSGALVLGAVATGMLLGHWYLIDLGLSLAPLRRLLRWYFTALTAQLAVFPLVLLGAWAASPDGAAAARALLTMHGPLLAMRLVLGPLAALALGWLIHRTLAIPQTMAATGLFYVAILAVMVGELLGRLVLFRTGLPL